MITTTQLSGLITKQKSEPDSFIALDNSWKKDKGVFLTVLRPKARLCAETSKSFFLDFNSPFDVKR